jgi:hypothetical protein
MFVGRHSLCRLFPPLSCASFWLCDESSSFVSRFVGGVPSKHFSVALADEFRSVHIPSHRQPTTHHGGGSGSILTALRRSEQVEEGRSQSRRKEPFRRPGRTMPPYSHCLAPLMFLSRFVLVRSAFFPGAPHRRRTFVASTRSVLAHMTSSSLDDQQPMANLYKEWTVEEP